MREHLSHVRGVVVDEVHELAGDRRGVQLTVGLERLKEVTVRSFQRVGLSATVGNPEEIAQFLGGNEQVRTVQIPLNKSTVYKVEYPAPGEAEQELARRLYTAPEAAARLSLVTDLVEAHDSTLIFSNSRVNAEMLGSKFHMMDQKIMVHHGSLPREERVRAEEAFKAGEIRGLVATSTLELGIDIGSVDLVVQYMSSRQVNSLVQRVGRSGHSIQVPAWGSNSPGIRNPSRSGVESRTRLMRHRRGRPSSRMRPDDAGRARSTIHPPRASRARRREWRRSSA